MLKEKILKPWKGVLFSHSCLSVTVYVCVRAAMGHLLKNNLGTAFLGWKGMKKMPWFVLRNLHFYNFRWHFLCFCYITQVHFCFQAGHNVSIRNIIFGLSVDISPFSFSMFSIQLWWSCWYPCHVTYHFRHFFSIDCQRKTRYFHILCHSHMNRATSLKVNILWKRNVFKFRVCISKAIHCIQLFVTYLYLNENQPFQQVCEKCFLTRLVSILRNGYKIAHFTWF